MNRFIGILILLVAAVAPSVADDNYVLRDGYYYSGDVPYTREKEWWQERVYVSQPYYHYQLQWKWKWIYTRVQLAYPPIPKAPEVPDNWEVRIAEVLQKQQRYAAYLEALKLVGANYSQPSYMQGSSVSLGAYGVSGQTLYGRSVTSRAELYGSPAELAMLSIQAADRHTTTAQEHGNQARAGFAQITGQLAIGLTVEQQKLLKLLATSDSAVKIIEALNRGEPKVILQQKTVEPFMPPAKDNQEEARLQRFGGLVSAKCGSCHGAEKQEGGLDMRQWPTFSAQRKDEINARLVPTLDPKKRMPLNHPPLTAAERIEFLRN